MDLVRMVLLLQVANITDVNNAFFYPFRIKVPSYDAGLGWNHFLYTVNQSGVYSTLVKISLDWKYI